MRDELEFLDDLELTHREQLIAAAFSRRSGSGWASCVSVGLDYLTLARAASTPLGRREPAHPAGHPDRLRPDRRAVCAGRAQHRPAPAGQRQLIATLKRLRDLGNTVIVVEHDEDTMRDGGFHCGHRPRCRACTAEKSWPPVPPRSVEEYPLGHGGLSFGQKKDRRARQTAPRQRALPEHSRSHGKQSEKSGCLHSFGVLYLRHRRIRFGQILLGQRDPLQIWQGN